jgi:GntR family transcriptional regulator
MSESRPRGASKALFDDLRARLESGEWRTNERLPSENDLAGHYGVSRATVRTALRALDGRGLTVTRRGLGTFATAATQALSANLQRLESISQTITRLGRRPGVLYRSIGIRTATAAEAASLLLPAGAHVLATSREFTADGEPVAYSHEALPRDVLGPDLDVRAIHGSLFDLLDERGAGATSALTSLHAADASEIGWGVHAADALFLMLEQTHFDDLNRPVAYSRTWFVEGRFQFNLIRVR